MQSLLRKELIEGERSPFAGDDAFRFSHILVRNAAYESMPKRTRADLHARFASWLDRAAGARSSEYEEIVGYHLEQAYRLRAELGPVDEVGHAFARRAGERLAHAGSRAFSRGDMPAAANLLDRAASLLPARDRARLRLLPDLAVAFQEAGQLERASALFEEAIEAAAEVGDASLGSRATVRRLRLHAQTDPGASMRADLKGCEHELQVLVALGDEGGLAEAWYVVGVIRGWLGRHASAEEALKRSIEHAKRTGDPRQERESLAWLVNPIWLGPEEAERGIRRLAEIFDLDLGKHKAGAYALAAWAHLAAMRGRFEEARRLAGQSRSIYEELGLRMDMAVMVAYSSGNVEMLAGDPARAEAELRWGYDILERMGEKGYLSTVAAVLSHALCAQGRWDEASMFTEISEEAASAEDVLSQVPWRGARARVLASRDAFEDAERLARQAIELARPTDFLDLHANALMDLAEVTRLANRPDEYAASLRQAIGLFERKGNTVMASRAKTLLEEPGAKG